MAKGLVLVPEKRELFGSMSVADNLLLGAFARHRRGDRDHAKTMDEVYAIFPRLAERHKQEAGTLSGGERQMLAMGRALMAKPTLLMLDEPSLGLAPLMVKAYPAVAAVATMVVAAAYGAAAAADLTLPMQALLLLLYTQQVTILVMVSSALAM